MPDLKKTKDEGALYTNLLGRVELALIKLHNYGFDQFSLNDLQISKLTDIQVNEMIQLIKKYSKFIKSFSLDKIFAEEHSEAKIKNLIKVLEPMNKLRLLKLSTSFVNVDLNAKYYKKMFSGLKFLNKLVLVDQVDSRFSNKSYLTLFNLLGQTNLKELILYGNDLASLDDRIIELSKNLVNIKSLKTLDLGSTRLHESKFINEFFDILSSSALEMLNLEDNQFGKMKEEIIDLAKNIEKFDQLRELKFYNSRIFSMLNGLVKNTDEYEKVENLLIEFVLHIINTPNLKKLKINEPEFVRSNYSKLINKFSPSLYNVDDKRIIGLKKDELVKLDKDSYVSKAYRIYMKTKIYNAIKEHVFKEGSESYQTFETYNKALRSNFWSKGDCNITSLLNMSIITLFQSMLTKSIDFDKLNFLPDDLLYKFIDPKLVMKYKETLKSRESFITHEEVDDGEDNNPIAYNKEVIIFSKNKIKEVKDKKDKKNKQEMHIVKSGFEHLDCVRRKLDFSEVNENDTDTHFKSLKKSDLHTTFSSSRYHIFDRDGAASSNEVNPSTKSFISFGCKSNSSSRSTSPEINVEEMNKFFSGQLKITDFMKPK